jgi:ketosteroid isomerase-like protein
MGRLGPRAQTSSDLPPTSCRVARARDLCAEGHKAACTRHNAESGLAKRFERDEYMVRVEVMTPEALMRKVTAAFEKADLQPLFDAVDDETVWKSASSLKNGFRFGGEYKKRAGVIDVTSRISTSYYFWHFKPKEIISHGEIVWGLFEVEADYKPANKPKQRPRYVIFECAIRWRVRDNKIIEHQAFFDTASLLDQQGELPHRER